MRTSVFVSVLADLLSLFYDLRASACDQQSDNHIAKKVRLTCDDVVINRDNAHVYKKKNLALRRSAKTMKEISVGLGMSSELGEGLALGMGRGMGVLVRVWACSRLFFCNAVCQCCFFFNTTSGGTLQVTCTTHAFRTSSLYAWISHKNVLMTVVVSRSYFAKFALDMFF